MALKSDDSQKIDINDLPSVDEERENSPTKSARKKKKKKTDPLTIEDIFNAVSTISAGMFNPPPARITLTPRSAESCLKHGVNPEVLKIRDLDSFWEPEIDPAVQVLRHEAYSQRRHELMRLCRAERKRIVADDMRTAEMARLNPKAGQSASSKVGLSPAQVMAEQEAQTANIIKMEEMRTEKLRLRQEKELEQMLLFETKQAQIQEELQLKLEQQKERQEQLKREQIKRQRQLAEERRARDLRKATLEEAEEERRRRAAKDMYEREQQVRREMEQREKLLRLEAERREEERLQKLEEYKARAQKMLDDQTEQIRRKFEDMEASEQVRKERLERQRKKEAKLAAEKRQMIEKRIENNVAMAKKIENQRKETFFEKQRQVEEKLREKEAEREMLLEEQRRIAEQQERKRQMALEATRREEEARKEELLDKFQEQEETLWRVKQMQLKEAMLEREKRELKKQLKAENVERIRRIQEYKRLETMRRINEGDKRASAIENQRREIIEKRRELGLKTKIQRDRLMELMDKIKTGGSKSADILQKVFNEEKESGNQKSKRQAKRSQSATNYKDMGGSIGSASAASILLPRAAHSAGETENGGLGPPPEASSLQRRLKNMYGSGPSLPAPYKSPYESSDLPALNGTKTVTF